MIAIDQGGGKRRGKRGLATLNGYYPSDRDADRRLPFLKSSPALPDRKLPAPGTVYLGQPKAAGYVPSLLCCLARSTSTDSTGTDPGRPNCRRCLGSSRYCSCCSNRTTPPLRQRRRLHRQHRANRSQDTRLSDGPDHQRLVGDPERWADLRSGDALLDAKAEVLRPRDS